MIYVKFICLSIYYYNIILWIYFWRLYVVYDRLSFIWSKGYRYTDFGTKTWSQACYNNLGSYANAKYAEWTSPGLAPDIL